MLYWRVIDNVVAFGTTQIAIAYTRGGTLIVQHAVRAGLRTAAVTRTALCHGQRHSPAQTCSHPAVKPAAHSHMLNIAQPTALSRHSNQFLSRLNTLAAEQRLCLRLGCANPRAAGRPPAGTDAHGARWHP